MDAFFKQGLLALAAVAAVAGVALTFAGPHGYGLFGFVFAALLACASVIWRNARWGVFATSLVALAANGYLFSRKWESAQATDAICNISQTINCDIVNSSKYSLAFGIPITLLGTGFFAGLAIAAYVAGDKDKRFFQTSSLFAVLNVAYSLFLAYQSEQLGAVCVLCVSIYLACFLILWGSLKGLQESGGAIGDDVGGVLTSRDFLVIAATFLVVVAVGGYAWKGAGNTSAPVATSPTDLAKLYEQPKGPLELDGTEPSRGPRDAKYTVVEFADFGCPHCAHAVKELKRIQDKHKDVRLLFKTFPLTGECHPKFSPGNMPERCQAAYAAECARQQGRFWEMEEALFENQGYFSPDDLKFMAEQQGLDVGKYQQCMQDPATAQAVIADATAGDAVGVRGTPSFFIKGTHGDQWIAVTQGPDAVDEILDAADKGTALPPAPPRAPDEQ